MKKNLLFAMLLSGLLSHSMQTRANNVHLPNIGTSALSTLTINKEMEMGDFYLRLLRSSAPLNYDPLINNYINQLGKKLVNNADSVQTPFRFFILQSQVTNAFAFMGGNVVIHSKLIFDTDTESELASVIAHEIAHVTQRHLARAIESQQKSQPYIWGSALGSILLGLANPSAGLAALTSTLASAQQNMLTFTQSNEQEADRIGFRTLIKAGFDPHAAATFLQKLANNARYSSKLPEMLLTHPLPDSRLSDIRNRVSQLRHHVIPSSEDYYLAKMRLVILTGNSDSYAILREDYVKTNTKQTNYALIYGDALYEYYNKNYTQAKKLLMPLLHDNANNAWFLDLITDIELEQHNANAAIARLQTAMTHDANNKILQLNLANAYLRNNEKQKAATLLHRYTHKYHDDTNGWELLATVYAAQRLRGEEMSARAELSALQGQILQAITLLTNAKKYLLNKPNLIERNNARIKQLDILQKRYMSNYQH